MNWNEIDWNLLLGLRGRFLSEQAATDIDYWSTPEALEQYDFTFGQRIRWKWNRVLREIGRKCPHFIGEGNALFDWGCGSGIATRAVLEHFPPELGSRVFLLDRSPLALEVAKQKINEAFPGTAVDTNPPPEGTPYVLLISHVLGELKSRGESLLQETLEKAEAVIWVEPGTPAISRHLIDHREKLRGAFDLWAPCPHSGPCGLLTPDNAAHWCHQFAEPPAEVFRDKYWGEFGKRMGIDLRSLPVSYLVMKRKGPRPAPRSGKARLLGRPLALKGHCKVLLCDEKGVTQRRLLQRDDRRRFKEIKQGGFDVELESFEITSDNKPET